MKKIKSKKNNSTDSVVIEIPIKNANQPSSILNVATPPAQKTRTWADIAATPVEDKKDNQLNQKVTSMSGSLANFVRTPLINTPSDRSRTLTAIGRNLNVDMENLVETESLVRSRSDSGHSFQSLQTIIGDVGFNTQILLTIDSEKKENQVSLYFTSLRPKTILGAPQGHHVISHRLVLEFCSKVVLNSKLVEIPIKIKAAFESIIPNIADLGSENGPSYPNVPDPENYLRCNEEMSKLLETSQGADHREAYEIGMRQKRISKVVEYLSDILAYYNAMVDVTHPRAESGGVNQGLEHSTIVALNAISHFLSFNQSVTLDQKKKFYRQAVEEHGEFVDGMIRIFDKPIAEIRKEDDFFEAFCGKSNNATLIGKIIEGLFDFSKTLTRTEKKLVSMSQRCIEMSLWAFPEFQALDKKEISKGFLEKVSVNQEWDLKPSKIQRFAHQISEATHEDQPVPSRSNNNWRR